MSHHAPAFKDMFTSREHRFSIGAEEISGRYFLSIPVSNATVDYEEYYEISASEFESWRGDPLAALEFAQQCRDRQMDARLMIQPGAVRGTPT